MAYKLQDLRRKDNRLPGELDRASARTMPAYTREAAVELNRRMDEAEDMLVDSDPSGRSNYVGRRRRRS